MTRTAIKLEGAQELIYALQGMEPQLAKRVLGSAMREGAKPMLATAKANCPVSVDGSHGNPPGTARNSLKIRAKKRRKGIVCVMIQTRAGDFKGKAFYVSFLEYGTKHIAALSFMRKAFDTTKMASMAIAKRQISVGIENVASSLWKPRKR